MTRSLTNRSLTNRSMTNRRSGVWVLLFAALALVAAPAFGQIGGRDISDSNLTEAERRDSTLLWLDTFLTESSLLEKDDIGKIRDAVAQMSPSQLTQWLGQTKQLRQYVESDKWQQTKLWLREFMRVQAIYSESEMQKLRNEIVQADSTQMLVILKRIQSKHESLVWMKQAAERNRQVEVEERDAYVAQQAAAADLARGAPTPPMPLVGSGAATGQKPSKGYRVPSQLIESRDISRAAVWAEFWGPGFLIGF